MPRLGSEPHLQGGNTAQMVNEEVQLICKLIKGKGGSLGGFEGGQSFLALLVCRDGPRRNSSGVSGAVGGSGFYK
jgi:hypothetical protein